VFCTTTATAAAAAVAAATTTTTCFTVVEFDDVMLLANLQARIAELEEELEAERASRSKVSQQFSPLRHPNTIDVKNVPEKNKKR